MLTRSRILAFVLVTALVGGAVTPRAIAAAPVQVTFVDAYAPAAGVAVPLYVCVDGVTAANLTTGVKGGPFALTAGSHLVEAYEASDSCAGTPTISTTVEVPDAAAATIVLGWGPSGPSAVVHSEPRACVPADVAEIVLRDAGSTGSAPSIWGARSGSGASAQLTATTTYAHQTSSDVFAGTFGDFSVRAGGVELMNFGTMTLAAGTVTQVYVYGGADGAAGAFSFAFPLATCSPSTTRPSGTVANTGAPSGTVADTPSGSTPASTPAPAPPAVPIRTSKPPTYIG